MKVKCWYCKEPFTPSPRDQELAIAWINTQRRKGANAPVIRHRFGIWAHGECVRLPNQESFQLEVPEIGDVL